MATDTWANALESLFKAQPERGAVHYVDATAALAEADPDRFWPQRGRTTPHFTIWRVLAETPIYEKLGGGWFRYRPWGDVGDRRLQLTADAGRALVAASNALRAGAHPFVPNVLLDDPTRRAEEVERRSKAMDTARALLLRVALQPEDVSALLRAWSTCGTRRPGEVTYSRFSPAFVGAYVRRYQDNVAIFNEWIAELVAASDEEVPATLDRLWARGDLPLAGTILPSTILHSLRPDRWFPWSESMAQGLLAFGLGGGRVDGSGVGYLRYCEGVRVLLEREVDLSPHLVDLALWREAFRAREDEAPPAEPPPPPPPAVGGSARPASKPPPPPTYTLDQLQADTGYERPRLEAIARAARYTRGDRASVGQVVLVGPPGTGKTWLAERIALHLVDGDASRVETVQFHPGFAYEHFIEGFRPRTQGGQMVFEREDGILRRLIKRIEATGQPHVLVIDEMNRGDLPQIFGEMMFLLSRRGTGARVRLPRSDDALTLPDGLSIIGTMNSADRSIAHLDSALRRRFRFFRIDPKAEILASRAHPDADPTDVAALVQLLEHVNETLRRDGDDSFQIGHAWLMGVRDEQGLQEVWEHEVWPAIEDGLDFVAARVKPFRWPEIRARFHALKVEAGRAGGGGAGT